MLIKRVIREQDKRKFFENRRGLVKGPPTPAVGNNQLRGVWFRKFSRAVGMLRNEGQQDVGEAGAGLWCLGTSAVPTESPRSPRTRTQGHGQRRDTAGGAGPVSRSGGAVSWRTRSPRLRGFGLPFLWTQSTCSGPCSPASVED